jgi:hypothetical protein
MYVMLDRVKGGGRAHPTLTSLSKFFHHGWNTRQKVAIATLCVLCGGHLHQREGEKGNMGEYRYLYVSRYFLLGGVGGGDVARV